MNKYNIKLFNFKKNLILIKNITAINMKDAEQVASLLLLYDSTIILSIKEDKLIHKIICFISFISILIIITIYLLIY
jgi:hypothetical protein